MARIKQIGVGRKTSGTIDGITYVTRKGVTYARATPTMPVSAYRTAAALKRQAIFKLIQMHLKYHLRTIRQTFTPKGNGTPTNRYYSVNAKALNLALADVADRLVAGEDISLTDVEAAISTYATAHPTSIRIASLSGYQEVFLTGEWPGTITLNANGGDSTVIIIVAENGTTTTITPDGVVQGSSSSSGSSQNQNENQNGGNNGSSGSNSSSGSNTGGNTGGSSTGSETSGTPVLTISKTGSGTASVTAGGNAVNSGAELAAETEVTLSVTPATGQTPTATLNGNTVELTESDGTYTGSFQMPSSNATLVINTGSAEGYGDTN